MREFFAISPETAYGIFETITELGGRKERLHLRELTDEERESEEMAQEIEEEHIERLSPFAFSKCIFLLGKRLLLFAEAIKTAVQSVRLLMIKLSSIKAENSLFRSCNRADRKQVECCRTAIL